MKESVLPVFVYVPIGSSLTIELIRSAYMYLKVGVRLSM